MRTRLPSSALSLSVNSSPRGPTGFAKKSLNFSSVTPLGSGGSSCAARLSIAAQSDAPIRHSVPKNVEDGLVIILTPPYVLWAGKPPTEIEGLDRLVGFHRSDAIEEPGLGVAPVPLHGALGQVEESSDF